MESQRTIKKDCHFSGKGIHTGVYTNMTISPAKENTGIVFIRTDKKTIGTMLFSIVCDQNKCRFWL